ncbi:MAG: fasciclin domain-containing protein [Bacteroidota bacterium]
MMILVSTVIACGDDDPEVTPTPNPETITEIAAADARFSTLVGALSRVGLDATLDGTGTFTVFAPTDAAFAAAGINLDDLSDQELTNVLLYHVLGNEVPSSAITAGKSYAGTLNETGPGNAALSILIEAGNQVVINNNATVEQADVEATNGVIHVINRVLLPLDVVDHAIANTDLQTLTGALGDASGDLVNVLKGDGPFTVFAPVNSGFDNVPSNLSADDLRDVLLYHVLAGSAVLSTDLADGNNYVNTASTSGPGNTALTVLVKSQGSGVSINDAANVTVANIVGTNGIIHVIDQVYTPLDIVGHAAINPDFSELVSALGAADGDLVSVLQGEGPFTVFAPINSAFDDIADIVVNLSTSDLAGVLTYHVVEGNIQSSGLSNNQQVGTVNGQLFTVNIDNGTVTLTDANGGTSEVIRTDVQATNGVIHVLNAVVIP